MIVVTLELWPGGDSSRAETLGKGVIINDGTGDLKTGNYYGALEGKTQRYQRRFQVKDYPRLSRHAWELLRRALNETDKPL